MGAQKLAAPFLASHDQFARSSGEAELKADLLCFEPRFWHSRCMLSAVSSKILAYTRGTAAACVVDAKESPLQMASTSGSHWSSTVLCLIIPILVTITCT